MRNIYCYEFTGTVAINGKYYCLMAATGNWRTFLFAQLSMYSASLPVRIYISIGTTINLDIKSTVVICKNKKEKKKKTKIWEFTCTFTVIIRYGNIYMRFAVWRREATDKKIRNSWCKGLHLNGTQSRRSVDLAFLHRLASCLFERFRHSLADKLRTFLLKDLYNPYEWFYTLST